MVPAPVLEEGIQQLAQRLAVARAGLREAGRVVAVADAPADDAAPSVRRRRWRRGGSGPAAEGGRGRGRGGRKGRPRDAAGDVDVEAEPVPLGLALRLQDRESRVRPAGLEEVDAHQDVGVGGEGAAVFFLFFCKGKRSRGKGGKGEKVSLLFHVFLPPEIFTSQGREE